VSAYACMCDFYLVLIVDLCVCVHVCVCVCEFSMWDLRVHVCVHGVFY